MTSQFQLGELVEFSDGQEGVVRNPEPDGDGDIIVGLVGHHVYINPDKLRRVQSSTWKPSQAEACIIERAYDLRVMDLFEPKPGDSATILARKEKMSKALDAALRIDAERAAQLTEGAPPAQKSERDEERDLIIQYVSRDGQGPSQNAYWMNILAYELRHNQHRKERPEGCDCWGTSTCSVCNPEDIDKDDLLLAAKWLDGSHHPHQGWTTKMQKALATEIGKARILERKKIVEWMKRDAPELEHGDPVHGAADEIARGEYNKKRDE